MRRRLREVSLRSDLDEARDSRIRLVDDRHAGGRRRRFAGYIWVAIAVALFIAANTGFAQEPPTPDSVRLMGQLVLREGPGEVDLGLLDEVEVERTKEWQADFTQYLRGQQADLLKAIDQAKQLNDETEAQIDKAIKDFNSSWS